jgi:hypothetical protein
MDGPDPEKTETAYQLDDGAVLPVEGVDLMQQEGSKLVTRHNKQGHTCCGGCCPGCGNRCCCDMRRAVIIVNIINIVIIVLGMMTKFSGYNITYDDDQVAAEMEAYRNEPLGLFIAFGTLHILLSAAGIVGALRYNVYLVAIAAAAYCFACVMALVALNPYGLLYPGFFAYPHFFFIKEVREGTMSKENYHNEELSCCCA